MIIHQTVAKQRLVVEFPEIGASVDIELDDGQAQRTVGAILDKLPIRVAINRWGEELYTDPMPVKVKELENVRSLVDRMDVAYWPEGQALCLFFGPTPISGPSEIKPYSPVTMVGRILSSQNVVKLVQESTPVVIRRQ